MSENSSREIDHVNAMSESERNRFIQVADAEIVKWNQTASANVRLRMARATDVPLLRRLNVQAVNACEREGLFMPMRENFLRQMLRDGIVILVEGNKNVLGYSIAIPAGRACSRFQPGGPRRKTGLLFGTALNPSLRGHGWQRRLIQLRLDMFREAQIHDIQSTVSPFNTASLRNLLSVGFHVSSLNVLLDGHPRFVLQYDFGQTVVSGPTQSIVLPAFGDLSNHAALLTEGLVAFKFKSAPPIALIYGSKQRSVAGTLKE